MAVLLRELIKNYNIWLTEVADQRTVDWPLVGSPIGVILITGSYLLFVLKIGPAFMKNRPPYKLDRLIQLYNLAQVVFCGYLTFECLTKIYGPWGIYSLICQPLDYADTPDNKYILSRIYFYFSLKILDLLDTIFFVLRKKQKQITFLHVYHHAVMVHVIWYAFHFMPGGHLIYGGAMNSLVHTVMYFYYLVSNYDKEYKKNVWWKKYITQLQLFQFASIVLHSLLLLAQPNCEYPRKEIILIILPQNLFLFAMFLDFYKKAYVNPARKPEAVKSE